MFKKIAVTFLLFLSVFSFSQCLECAKNIGGWTDESAIDIEKTPDGFVFLVDSNGFTSSRIIKYDFNCNIIWEKNFTNLNIDVKALTSDDSGNIYLIIYNTTSTNNTSAPWNINGFIMSHGLNFYKLDSLGNILWNKNIGPYVDYDMQNIFHYQNQIFVTGNYFGNLNFNNGVIFNNPINQIRAFLAKYDTNGNFINAVNHGNGSEIFKYSEIDNQGNIYLTRSNPNATYSSIEKFNSQLVLNWSKTLSTSTNPNNTGIYTPTGIKFNNVNNKLYLWGKMNLSTTILGNNFFINNNNGIFQSALVELNSNSGDLENIKRFDNNSSYGNSFPSAVAYGKSAQMVEKNNFLYILTSFSNNMSFPNATISSSTYGNGNNYSEELVLFKMNLLDFSSEFILKSYGVQNLPNYVTDLPGPMLFNNDDLYLTATFGSDPIQINGATINNNSGNNDPDAMLYKYNINSSNTNYDEIIVNNTCLNEITNFNISGNYDLIVWNFGDPLSSNNIINGTNNTSHQYTSAGNYHVTVTVTCGTESQVFEKEIIISTKPNVTNISPISECETISGSGICTNFDTSLINSQLVGNQQNITIEFRHSNGQLIPNPLPNPYTNTNLGGDIINAKVYYTNNEDCFVETQINFNVLTKPNNPNTNSPQTFCIQQNATINTITITGQNIKWYDALTNGNLLPNSTTLVNGTTYYASQTINGCESNRVPVTIQIQNTPAPTGNANQSFCSTANATVADIVVTGTNIIWYTSATNTSPLSNSTLLVNNITYYATQTSNGCESVNRLAVTISLINTLNATNYAEIICDNLNDNQEISNLTSYHANLISSTGNIFTYYNNYNDALNQNSTGQINNFANYNLTLGTSIFYVRIDSPNSCFQVVTLTLELVSKPIIPVKDIEPLCEGKNIILNSGNNYDTYTWSTGETTQTITITQAGSYSVIVSENHGVTTCTSTKNFIVVNSNIATIQEIISSDWTENNNTITVLLQSNSQGDYEYSINGIDFQNSNVFNNLEAGEYIVFVRDKNGCGLVSEELYLLMYPKFFTPNGDGYNDFWKIKFSENEPNLFIKIFDRYGKLLKVMDANSIGWDGKYLEKDVTSSDYWFVVTRENGKVYKGHFSLKR